MDGKEEENYANEENPQEIDPISGLTIVNWKKQSLLLPSRGNLLCCFSRKFEIGIKN